MEVSAAQAIRSGIAPDGGLFTPETIPALTQADLQALLPLTYQELAARILSLYLTDFDPADLERMIAAAYAYPAKWADPAITPVTRLAEGQYVLELFHGPTCAFKDVALQLLPHLMTRSGALCQDTREIVILVATSGDTGKAALEGFRDVPGTRIVVFFPEQGVSDIQRLQMVTQEGANTAVVAVRGNFDDAQNGVKQIFTDPAMMARLARRGMAFSSANSINWGRLAPQLVYYFYGYLELCRRGALKLGDPLNVAVPTGNFGNILAAYFAKEMGLPLGKLICASNSNNVLTDFIASGAYDRKRPFYTTVSPSMDILISSNLERLLYYLGGQDAAKVRRWMEQLKSDGAYRVDAATAARIADRFGGGYASEAETLDTIGRVFRDCGYVMDTHTAVGKAVYDRYAAASGDRTPVLIAATASPFKFNSSVLRALSGSPAGEGASEFELLEQLHSVSGQPIPAGLRALDQKPVRHDGVCAKEAMAEAVAAILKV
jgi:threonine synthase